MTHLKFFRILSVLLVGGLCCVARPAQATFHAWDIVEAFSSADGSVQFIEMFTNANGQHLANTQSGGISSNANPFSFPMDLPSGTTNKTFLVGTTSYESLAQTDVNVPLPDYVVVDDFFSTAGDTLDLNRFTTSTFDTITFTAAELPTDGTNSLNHAFGDFSNTSSSAINSPKNFAGETGTVTIVNPSANFDEDTDVDGADFLTWQRGFGADGGLAEGDANSSGFVDAADLVVWEDQYGLPVATLSGLASVPEPQSLSLLICGMLAISRVRGRRT